MTNTGTARTPPPLEIVPDQWYAVLEARKLGARPVALRRLGDDFVLYRTASGAIGCFTDRCPHRGVALSLGRVAGEELECGYHAFRFSTDGACTTMPCDGPGAKIPAAMRAASFPAREAHGLVWIWWGAPREQLPEIPWIPEVPSDDAAASDTSFVWPVPTFRAVQSSFDFHHSPVLHGRRSLRFTQIPRLMQLDEVTCDAEDERIEFSGVLRDPQRAGEGGIRCHTSFRMPGLSYLRLGSFGRFAVFDTPIDAGTTFRFYRNISKVGRALGLGKLLAWAEQHLDLRVGTQFKEDLPMVITQAHPSELFSDTFARADAGAAQYERLRRKLLRTARARAPEYPLPVRLRLGSEVRSPDTRVG